MTVVHMKFLVEHKLNVVEPFQEDGSLKEDLVQQSSDLTDLGNKFFKEVFPKWSAYIYRGGDIQKTTMLLKGLTKLTSCIKDETDSAV